MARFGCATGDLFDHQTFQIGCTVIPCNVYWRVFPFSGVRRRRTLRRAHWQPRPKGSALSAPPWLERTWQLAACRSAGGLHFAIGLAGSEGSRGVEGAICRVLRTVPRAYCALAGAIGGNAPSATERKPAAVRGLPGKARLSDLSPDSVRVLVGRTRPAGRGIRRRPAACGRSGQLLG